MNILKIIFFFITTGSTLMTNGNYTGEPGCHYDVDIIESHHVSGGSIVSRPIVADINADGTLDIIAATFDGTIDIVDGTSLRPHAASQWPYQLQNSTIYTSPLLFDYDGNGIKDVLVFTSDGKIVYFKPDGTLLHERTVKIPPIMVARRWLQDGSAVDTELSRFVSTSKESAFQTDSFIALDAHILTTPLLADLNGDGREEELVLPVSYYHAPDSLRTDHGSDTNLDVVVSALVIVNLTNGDLIREILLHLSKQSDPAPAYLLHPPTIVDLDSQGGPLDVIMATTSGQLHALDSKGQERAGFPINLRGAVTGQITVEDLDDDGNLEMIVTKTSGEITCLSNHGDKKWSAEVSGSSFPGSRLADLDDDGVLDVVIPTSDGNIWALAGKTGTPLQYWPVYVGSRLVSNAVVTSLTNSSHIPELIVTGYDGNLYIISTPPDAPPCVESIGLEEGMLAPVIVADMIPSWPGAEVVAATIHGSLMLLSTEVDGEEGGERESRGSWSGEATSEHKFACRQQRHGVFVAQDTRQKTYVAGSRFTVEFDITDLYQPKSDRSYEIKVFVGSICLHPSIHFSEPGRKTLQASSPGHPVTALVEIHMMDRHGRVHVDSFPVSFNTKITDEIQWLLVIPMVAMAILLLILYGYPDADLLPTSVSSKDR